MPQGHTQQQDACELVREDESEHLKNNLCYTGLLPEKITHHNQNPVKSNSPCLIKPTPRVFCSKQLILSAGETEEYQPAQSIKSKPINVGVHALCIADMEKGM